MKKLMLACVAACAAAVAFAEKSISLVKVADGRATVTFEGEGTGYQSLVLAYGAEPGGDSVESWEHSIGVGAVARDQMSVSVPLPGDFGLDCTNGKFFLYDGIAGRSDGYIRDGLAAQWDAIDLNADGTHPQQGVKTWKDLVSGREFVSGQDAVIAERSIRFAADASLDAESSSLLLDNGITTVESMISVYESKKEMILGTASSGLDWFDYTHLYFVKASSAVQAKGIPWGGKPLSTYSAVYDQSQDGAAKLKAAYRNGLDEWNSSMSYWNGGQDCMVIKPTCTLNTLRIYDRRLSEDELKANAAVDTARYVNLSTTDQIGATYSFTSDDRVVSVLPGEHGTGTGGGIYRKGQQVTLTATPDAGWTFFYWSGLPAGVDATRNPLAFTVEDHVTVTPVFMDEYRPVDPVVGRSVEVSAVEKDDSGKPVAVTVSFGPAADGTDRIDTLYVAWGSYDAGEDIRFWPNVQAVRAILSTENSCRTPIPEGWGKSVRALRFFFFDQVNADSYIKENLVAQWDGADNVGTGAHDSGATVWIDRVGGGSFNLFNATVGERSVDFAGTTESYGNMSAEDTERIISKKTDRTIEMCFDTRKASNPQGCVMTAPGSIAIAPWNSTCYFGYISSLPIYNVDMSSPAHQVVLNYDGAGTRTGVFVDGKTPAEGSAGGWNNIGSPNGMTWLAIGRAASGNLNAALGCEIYGLRVYHAILSDAQRAVNLAVDQKVVRGEVTTGTLVSCSPALKSDEEVKSRFTVTAEAFCGVVTGTGEYDEGVEVTVSVTMQERCRFIRWTGDVPAGVEPTNASITFTPTSDVALKAEVWTPWLTVCDGEGIVKELYNADWHFSVTATDEKLTLDRVMSGGVETLDLADVESDTGFKVSAIGANVFSNVAYPKCIRHAGADLKQIGTRAFYKGSIERFDPVVLAGLEIVESSAFEESHLKSLLAPNLRTAAERSFYQCALTNFVKGEVLDIPMSARAFGGLSAMSGSLTIDSPSTTIPSSFLWGCGLTNVTVNSPVVKIDDWGFGEHPKGDLDIYWNVAAPTEFGVNNFIGTLATAPRYMRLHIRRDADGWRKCPYFVPITEIDAKYRARAYGWEPGAIGWMATSYGLESNPCRCWVIQKQGLILLVW